MVGRGASHIQGELQRLLQIEISARRWREAQREAHAHPDDAMAQDLLREAEDDHARVVDRLAS